MNMANGNIDDVWKKVNHIEAYGCASRSRWEKNITDIWASLEKERGDRETMRDKLEDKMNSVRNQILLGIGVMLVVAVVMQKLLGG